MPPLPLMPDLLSESGLYSDIASGVIAPWVREFRPASELWTDNAFKRRWVYLPPGETINTSNMDYWVLPVGTRLWKEFVRDGVRLETRYLAKVGPRNWFARTYVWNEELTDAEVDRFGLPNAGGTDHDIPDSNTCLECHGDGQSDEMTMSFTALQLDHDLGGLNLEDLVAEGLLSSPPAGAGVPYFQLPGDTLTQDTLRYLHANCGHCHNERFDQEDADIEMRLLIEDLAAITDTAVYRTALCGDMLRDVDGATHLLVPGQPDLSSISIRMNQRDTEDQMPKIGTELTDPVGLFLVQQWISSMEGTCSEPVP